MMRGHLLITAAILIIPIPVLAQGAPSSNGMRHMSVTTDAAKPPASSVEKKTDTAPAVKPEEKPAPKALKPEDALKKTDTLTAWPYYTDLMTIGNDTALEKVIHSVTIDPGSVPPKGLFFLAKALSDRKRYEEAAFYYYAGQLRATFDMARFPPYQLNPSKEDNDKRTEDQKGGPPSAPPEMVNPHDDLSMLALSIGQPIARWAMNDPTRLETVMMKVRDWDLATPYAYLPDYDISRPAPFETWPSLLSKTRSDYFTRVRQIAQGLTAVKPAAPTPSFSRP